MVVAGMTSYVVQNPRGSFEQVAEKADEGNDTVYSAKYFILGTNLENLTLTTRGDFSVETGEGNELDNRITGSNFSDRLIGNAGHDTFAFTTVLDAANNVDQILDFSIVDDTIQL